MVPDPVTLGAYKSILDVGVVGAVCVLLMIAMGLVVRYFKAEVDKREVKLVKEEEAHDKTRAALLEEVKSGREVLSLVRQQMASQSAALDAVLKSRGT